MSRKEDGSKLCNTIMLVMTQRLVVERFRLGTWVWMCKKVERCQGVCECREKRTVANYVIQ